MVTAASARGAARLPIAVGLGWGGGVSMRMEIQERAPLTATACGNL